VAGRVLMNCGLAYLDAVRNVGLMYGSGELGGGIVRTPGQSGFDVFEKIVNATTILLGP
jgi:hypothetical protein